MNDSTAATLPMGGVEYSSRERWFKNIKIRAGKREVSFSIQTLFVKYFKSFLKLREFVLENEFESSTKLFFEMPGRKSKGISDLRSDGHAAQLILKLDPFNQLLPRVTARACRVSKGQWVCKEKGLEVASYVLQNSKSINIKHYNDATQETVDKEVSSFLNNIGDHVHSVYDSVGSVETEIGGCTEPNSPKNIAGDTQFLSPDCKNFEGCLFCEHFVLHTDSTDIRKLLSLEFFLQQLKYLLPMESYQEVYAPVEKRLSNILDYIRNKSKKTEQLLNEVHQEVFDKGMLSNYWARKFELLDELGVLR